MTKSIFGSKTFWGGIIMIVPTLLSFFNINITPSEIEAGTGMLSRFAASAAEIIGFAMVIIGRFKAVKPVTLLGG